MMAETIPFQLSPPEWEELIGLMREARYLRPSMDRERRLREILSKRNPRARSMPWRDLVHFGLVVLGAYNFVRTLSPDPSAAALV